MRVSKGSACSARNCTNNKGKNPELSFFTFPKDPERSKLWITKSERLDLLNKEISYLHKNCTLCTLHFEDDQFMNFERKRLIPNAIPTIFLSENKELIQEQISNLNLQQNNMQNCKPKCCVKGCKSGRPSKYKFPNPIKNQDFFRKWVNLCGNIEMYDKTPQFIYMNYRICRNHFIQEDLGSKNRLFHNAYPKINLPETIDCQTSEIMEIEHVDVNETDFYSANELEVENSSDNPNLSWKINETYNSLNYLTCDKSNEIKLEDYNTINNNCEEEQEFDISSVKTLTENTEICRTCFQSIAVDNVVKLFDEDREKKSKSIRDMLTYVLPELNLNLYPNPVVCTKCWILLENSYEFKKTFTETEEKLQNYISSNFTEVVILPNDSTIDIKDNLVIINETLLEEDPISIEDDLKNIQVDHDYIAIIESELPAETSTITTMEPLEIVKSTQFLNLKHKKKSKLNKLMRQKFNQQKLKLLKISNRKKRVHYINQRNRRFQCNYCCKKFLFYQYLVIHCISAHFTYHLCQYCGK